MVLRIIVPMYQTSRCHNPGDHSMNRLRTCVVRVLRQMFGPMREEVTRANCIMWSYIICSSPSTNY
jgi:hypothetical protein